MFQSYEQIVETMEDALKEMKHVRWKTIIKCIIGWLLLPFSVVVPGLVLLTLDGYMRLAVAVIWIVVVTMNAVFLSRTYRRFRRVFKDLIVKNMVKQLIETCELPEEIPGQKRRWRYAAGKTVSPHRISRSGLFHIEKGDKLSGHDRVSGQIGLTKFYLSMLTLYKVRRYRTRKGHRRRRYTKKYKGVLFLADFNKNFHGHTLLRDRRIRSFRHLRRYIRLMFHSFIGGKHLHRIRLESKDFNRLFKTKTSDEVQARYILTAAFMERLVAFRKKRRDPIDISFQHNYISISLSSKKDFYEPSIFRPMKQGQVKDVYDDLVFFFSIMEDLNLNTRIWRKA